jgi:NAD(P)-dependent dehydrogenase (short-subunit alcohol dehydrogenase family)
MRTIFSDMPRLFSVLYRFRVYRFSRRAGYPLLSSAQPDCIETAICGVPPDGCLHVRRGMGKLSAKRQQAARRERMRITLEGKVALITGAGAGIGKAIAEAYDAIGAALVIAEIDADKCAALARQFPDALIGQCDVRDVAAVEILRDRIVDRFGRLDILVNNVGHHLGIRRAFDQSTEDEWQAMYDINLRQMMIVTRAMIPLMKRAGAGGSIINLSSVEGFRGFPYNIVYTTFKHAVTGFTRGLAIELSSHGIRVNLIAPETTDSEQVPLDRILATPEMRAQADGTIPLGRFGTPRDHAGAAVYLATDLSAWVTGQSLIVDGGAMAAGVFQRTPEGEWTNMPIVSGRCTAGVTGSKR